MRVACWLVGIGGVAVACNATTSSNGAGGGSGSSTTSTTSSATPASSSDVGETGDETCPPPPEEVMLDVVLDGRDEFESLDRPFPQDCLVLDVQANTAIGGLISLECVTPEGKPGVQSLEVHSMPAFTLALEAGMQVKLDVYWATFWTDRGFLGFVSVRDPDDELLLLSVANTSLPNADTDMSGETGLPHTSFLAPFRIGYAEEPCKIECTDYGGETTLVDCDCVSRNALTVDVDGDTAMMFDRSLRYLGSDPVWRVQMQEVTEGERCAIDARTSWMHMLATPEP